MSRYILHVYIFSDWPSYVIRLTISVDANTETVQYMIKLWQAKTIIVNSLEQKIQHKNYQKCMNFPNFCFVQVIKIASTDLNATGVHFAELIMKENQFFAHQITFYFAPSYNLLW